MLRRTLSLNFSPTLPELDLPSSSKFTESRFSLNKNYFALSKFPGNSPELSPVSIFFLNILKAAILLSPSTQEAFLKGIMFHFQILDGDQLNLVLYQYALAPTNYIWCLDVSTTHAEREPQLELSKATASCSSKHWIGF